MALVVVNLVNTELTDAITSMLLPFLAAGSSTNLAAHIVDVFRLSVHVNFYLALFNMLPLPMLDGRHVLRWNRLIWAIGMVMIVLSYIVCVLLHVIPPGW